MVNTMMVNATKETSNKCLLSTSQGTSQDKNKILLMECRVECECFDDDDDKSVPPIIIININ